MSGGSQTSNSTTSLTLPIWAQGPYKNSSQDWLAAQGALPSIAALYNTTPQLQVPNLQGPQLNAIGQLEGLPTVNPAYGTAGGLYGNAAGLYGGLTNPGSIANQAYYTLANESVRNPSWNQAISDYNQLPSIATGYYNTAANQAQQLYNQFAPGSTGGVSPAIQAAQNQFQKLQLPTIENLAANMGQGNSGAALEAASTGEMQALTPLLQEQAQLQASTGQNLTSADLARAGGITGAYGTAAGGLGSLGAQQQQLRQAALEAAASGSSGLASTAAGGLGNVAGGQTQLGGAAYQQQLSSLTNALQAAGMPYEVAVQQAQAYFDRLQQQQQLAQTVQLGPFSQIPAIFGGSNTVTTTSGGQPLF